MVRQAPSVEEKTRRPAGLDGEETVPRGTGRAAGITAGQRGANPRPWAPMKKFDFTQLSPVPRQP
jgi:hypothetical protein